MVSRQPLAVRASSRTVAVVRTAAPLASASASGSAPRPSARVVNTGCCAGPSCGPGPSIAAAASASDRCFRDSGARPGSVASNDSRSARPAYTPPSSGSTRRSTTSDPNLDPTNLATATSPSLAVAARTASCRARSSPAGDRIPDRSRSPKSAGTPMNCRLGSWRNRPLVQMLAVVVPGYTSCSPRPIERIRSTPSGRLASRASAPASGHLRHGELAADLGQAFEHGHADAAVPQEIGGRQASNPAPDNGYPATRFCRIHPSPLAEPPSSK